MTPQDFNPDYLVPGMRIGGYVVRTMLGQGGSSSVYEVESAEGHRFALKVCRYHGGAHGTSEWRVDQRYSRSIICLQLLKGLRNVADLYAHDRHPDPLHGYQYLVQELVPGGLLITDWVKRESPTLRKLVGAFVELADLCGVMASKGICHRDLKPPNILVTPDGTPKVIDFESATCPHVAPVTRREASAVPGTGGWQSPELCQAILEEQSKKKSKEPFDFLPWGDLFSLGVVFYECLTGEHPFDTSLPDDMLLAEIAFETPIHPVQLSAAVPLGLNKVVMRLLERQPEARYHDGAEVASDLRKLLKNVKDARWDKPFKQPTHDDEAAPVLSLVSVLVPPESPAEKESQGPMPDTPSSEPHGQDTGAHAEPETPRDAISSPQSATADVSSAHSAETDVGLRDEQDTAEPRGLRGSAALDDVDDAEGSWTFPRVLELGKAGSYTVERRLGRGGMGEVYLARQAGARGFSQLVAIKRLRPGGREWEARSFADEARILSRLHHENIARVYGFFELEGNPYLVMEYVEGNSLYTLLELARRQGHRFSESVACAVMAAVADALDCAHHVADTAGRPLHIVHRDVSTTNILIAKAGRVVLLDFGVALFNQEGRVATRTGATFIKGKPPYLSPEQVKHQPLDARSDLFSVGTILVELLTGEAPFGWTADLLTLKRIEAVTPEYVASRLPGISKPLRVLCQKLLAFSPDERFATGREVAAALRKHAGLGEGPEGIQAAVERLQALPDTKGAPVAAEVAARAFSRMKRPRRAVTLAGAAMLATFALLAWYVPRHAAPAPASSLLQGPVVSLSRPEKSVAPAPSVFLPPPDPLVNKTTGEGGTAVAAGPARQHKVVSPPAAPAPSGERAAPPVVLAAKGDEPAVTAPPVGRGSDGAAPAAPGSDDAHESRRSLRDKLVASQGQLAVMKADYVKVSGEALSPQHALAALFATGNAQLAHFYRASSRRLTANGVSARVAIWKPRDDDDSGTVAVVVDLTNPDDAPPWEPTEGRIVRSDATTGSPVAVRAMPQVIAPGQRGRVALVFNQAEIDEKAMVEILRDSRPEFAMEITSRDLERQKSLWPF